MDDGTKQQHKALADYAEERANQKLDRALELADHGPQAVIGELVEAGSLLAAAAELRKRAE